MSGGVVSDLWGDHGGGHGGAVCGGESDLGRGSCHYCAIGSASFQGSVVGEEGAEVFRWTEESVPVVVPRAVVA